MSTLQNRPTPKFPMPDTMPTKAVWRNGATFDDGIRYSDRDGRPMADNTLQYEWIAILKWELDALFLDNPNVFVAGDLLWYPVKGDNKTRTAPDTMVAFGRPKGFRGSYIQWQEEDIPPQVVFEVLSKGNRPGEMNRKRAFYETYGVEEYYLYNPYKFILTGWLRDAATNLLTPIDRMDGFISPRLGIRFDAPGKRALVIYGPNGSRFRNPVEVQQELGRTEQQLEITEQRLEVTEQRLENTATERDRLAAKLRELGIDPETLR